MTDILEMIDMIKDSTKLNSHPLIQMDLELKMHYLNGLALLMNVDGEIHEKEKEYLSALINISGMSDDTLKNLLEFCTDPDPELVKEMIQELKKDAKIAKLFLLDLLVLSEKDGHFHDKEKDFISKISEHFSVPMETVSFLENIATALKTKDQVFLLILLIDNIPLYEEVSSFLGAFGMDIKDEFEKLFDFQFERWEFEEKEDNISGEREGIIDDNPVSNKPVSNSQFCEFLNYAYYKKTIKKNKNSKFAQGKDLLIDLDHSDINFDKGGFTCPSKGEYPVTGITYLGALSFVKWVNDNILEDKSYKIDLLTLGTARTKLKSPHRSSLNEICLLEPTGIFSIVGNFAKMLGKKMIRKLPSSFFSGKHINFSLGDDDPFDILQTHLNKNLTFRVMKIKNKGEEND
jgi:tellurite resistance protein